MLEVTCFSFFFVCLLLSNHNAISRLRPHQKMQRYREGLLCEWRRLLLHRRCKSALLQVSGHFYFYFLLIHSERWCFFVNRLWRFFVRSRSLYSCVCVCVCFWLFFFSPAVYFPDSTWFPFFFLSAAAAAAAATHHRKMLPVCLTTHLLCILTLIMEWGGGALILLSHV